MLRGLVRGCQELVATTRHFSRVLHLSGASWSGVSSSCYSTRPSFRNFASATDEGGGSMEDKESLRKRLTPLQYHVTQEAGTEGPFSGKLNKCYDAGTYVCIVCRQELFSSDTKYDSGCGWPAFNDVLAQEKVTLHKDTSTGNVRTEVRCAKCNAHLGHVFGDGPKPTGKRFCINSVSMDFVPANQPPEGS